jgi:hypothetical protein
VPLNYYPDDGGPTRIFNNSVQLVPSTREDASKRNALVASGKFWVWSVTWEDVKSAMDGKLETTLADGLEAMCFNTKGQLPQRIGPHRPTWARTCDFNGKGHGRGGDRRHRACGARNGHDRDGRMYRDRAWWMAEGDGAEIRPGRRAAFSFCF